jgi:hypothetical protein
MVLKLLPRSALCALTRVRFAVRPQAQTCPTSSGAAKARKSSRDYPGAMLLTVAIADIDKLAPGQGYSRLGPQRELRHSGGSALQLMNRKGLSRRTSYFGIN